MSGLSTPENNPSFAKLPTIASSPRVSLTMDQDGGQSVNQPLQTTTNSSPPETRSDHAPAIATRPVRPPPGPRSTSHARFPDDQDQLEQHMPSAPRITSPVPSDAADEEKQVGEDETIDPPPTTIGGRIRRYITKLGQHFRPTYTAPEPLPEALADTGIDLSALNTLQERRASSIVSCGLALSGVGSPGYAKSQSTASLLKKSSSSPGTGTVTPSSPGTGTPRKKKIFGLDPESLSGRLRTLARKNNDPRSSSSISYDSEQILAAREMHDRRLLCINMARAFMLFGAPAHRLEEYVLRVMTVCSLQGTVNYTIGCTEICFHGPPNSNDPTTKQSFTTMVKTTEMLNIGELERVFEIFKSFVHKVTTVEEAGKDIQDVIRDYPARDYPALFKIIFYGLSAGTASIWAFHGSWLDMYPAFILGCVIGYFQVYVASKSSMYANVFETAAAVIASFGGRAFASIGGEEQIWFCFIPIASGAIAPILPGYIVLCGALEIQAKTITAGTTRLFYAVLYSLFLGYGFNIGAQLLGLAIPSAPDSTMCPRAVDERFQIILVPLFLASQSVLLGSKLGQLPRQIFIGSASYTVQHFVAKHSTSQIAVTASTFTLGVLGHLYSRLFEGFAFTAVVAGIMTLVPSGLSAQGGLLVGLSTPLFNNGTMNAQDVYDETLFHSFSVAAQMISVAVGATFGLFLSVLFVYALGKKQSTTLLSF